MILVDLERVAFDGDLAAHPDGHVQFGAVVVGGRLPIVDAVGDLFDGRAHGPLRPRHHLLDAGEDGLFAVFIQQGRDALLVDADGRDLGVVVDPGTFGPAHVIQDQLHDIFPLFIPLHHFDSRNREPLRAVLEQHLPEKGLVLEVGSGTGEHAAYFAQRFPGLTFQPTDFDTDNHASIAAHTQPLTNVRAPIALDASGWPWPIERADVLWAFNVIHISPPEVLAGLMRGAGELLPSEGLLLTYGPYRIRGEHTAPSNERFESWLKSLDPRFGVRELEDVVAQANANGLDLRERVPMPANNFTLVFEKR